MCSACRAELPLSGFDRNRAMRDGLNNQCRTCARASRDRIIAKDPAKWREYQKAWNRKHRYGLSVEEYAALAAVAGGKCQVCGQPPKAPFKTLDVDHDHVTGKVRGLLCRPCNTAVGVTNEDPGILRALADYIEVHKE
jgi:hypothetical protein